MTPEEYAELSSLPEGLLSDEQYKALRAEDERRRVSKARASIAVVTESKETDDELEPEEVQLTTEALVLPPLEDDFEEPTWMEPEPSFLHFNGDPSTHGLAKSITAQLHKHYSALVRHGRVWIWDDTSQYRRLSASWLWAAAGFFHGEGGAKGEDGLPGTRGFVGHGHAKSDVEAQVLTGLARFEPNPDADPFEHAAALLAFGDGTYIWTRRGVRFVENAAKHRATDSYPFNANDGQPTKLPVGLTALLWGYFKGVDPKEAELRIKLMCTHAGLAMLGAQWRQADAGHLVLVGAPGCGKSTWSKLLESCLPKDSVSHSSWAAMGSRDPFTSGMACLCFQTSRLNIDDDAMTTPIKDTGNLKKILSFDTVPLRGNGSGAGRTKEVKVKASQLILANHLLNIDDKGGGMSRRMIYCEIPTTVTGKPDEELVVKLLDGESKAEFVRYCVALAIGMLDIKGKLPRPQCHAQMLRQQSANAGDPNREEAANWVKSNLELEYGDKVDMVNNGYMYLQDIFKEFVVSAKINRGVSPDHLERSSHQGVSMIVFAKVLREMLGCCPRRKGKRKIVAYRVRFKAFGR